LEDPRDYDYDHMGNLSNRKEGTSTNNYHTANALNEYSSASRSGVGFTPSYDAAGNMTYDGLFTYTYDAKNQLVRLDAVGSSDYYVFDYDPLGRRVAKSGTGLTETRFVYQGWNLIAELDTNGEVLKKYTWGLDASGTLQGAGGVGGLLMIEEGSSQYYPVYDGLNNVIGLHDQSGALVAWYEYDPFGRLLGSGGTKADVNPFRFSTKYTDFEIDADLVYYGLRYYHSEMGRFVNRDPIGIAGGLNLYGFVGNDPVNFYDYLGMQFTSAIPDRETDYQNWLEYQLSLEVPHLSEDDWDNVYIRDFGYTNPDDYYSDFYGPEETDPLARSNQVGDRAAEVLREFGGMGSAATVRLKGDVDIATVIAGQRERLGAPSDDLIVSLETFVVGPLKNKQVDGINARGADAEALLADVGSGVLALGVASLTGGTGTIATALSSSKGVQSTATFATGALSNKVMRDLFDGLHVDVKHGDTIILTRGQSLWDRATNSAKAPTPQYELMIIRDPDS